MTNLIKHLALVSESERVDMSDLLIVAAALQKQASRDLAPIWGIGATVDAFARLEDLPLDYWPMIVRDDIGYDAAGIHRDDNGQPFALISSSADRDTWSLTASHEALEMLVDPFGDRQIAGDSPKNQQGRVNFLVEVCDPSEDASFAYSINSVLVSDFYTPRFFDPVTATGVRYSFTDAIRKPRSIVNGGYLSWLDLETRDWWQQIWFGTASPQFRNIGKLDGTKNIRSQIDRITWADTARAIEKGRAGAVLAGMPFASSAAPSKARAAALRAQIEGLSRPN